MKLPFRFTAILLLGLHAGQLQAYGVANASGDAQIGRIEAGGRTGLWSSVATVCKKHPGSRTLLSWNVKDRAAKRVVLYAVDTRGVERHFYQSGPIGEKESGPWLRPGFGFKIRDYASGEALASVIIGDKPC